MEVTGPVTPPPPASPAGSPPPPGAPAPAPASGPVPPPGAGDFPQLLQSRGIVLPPGKDPVALATQTCQRFDGGQVMVDVSNWIGTETGLNPEQQGFFLGTAVATYCPQDVPKLG